MCGIIDPSFLVMWYMSNRILQPGLLTARQIM